MICTPAFGLPVKYIFHAVCPAWQGGGFGEAEQLAGAYHSALELFAEYHCESVAFPLLSSGTYGYPKEQAFRIAEAFYGMPPELQQETLKRLPEDRTGRTAKHPPVYCVQSTVHGRVRFCCGLFALSEQVET